jgi:dimethylargininase
MPLIAVTREVSASINECELSFHSRQPIDVKKAIAQHKSYQDCLAGRGAQIVCLAAEPNLPDSTFIEDTAVVLDELAIIANMGAPSRRPETESMAQALARYRRVKFLVPPATLDGGDVLRVGRTLFVGLSRRTNRDAVAQLNELLRPYDYEIKPVAVRGCLHLKSACSHVGHETILVNRSWIDAEQLHGFDLLDVPEQEPAAANALMLGEVVIIAASFQRTQSMLQKRGFRVQTIDMSELQKAEAGVTCCSLLFKEST